MKKQIKMAIIMAFAALTVVSCSDLPGYKKTDKGLYYKFVKQDKKAQQAQKGDVLVAEITMRINEDTLFSNVGQPGRMLQVGENMFDGDLHEGLLMMHVGDVASFAIDADKMAKFYQGHMPPQYKENNGDKIYYDITLVDIVTKEEIAEEQNNFQMAMEERRTQEPEIIANFIKENNITAKPNANGVYVIVKKQGNGPKVAVGKEVSMNYTGRLLDGTMFDTSVEKDAREGGIYQQGRPYEPLSYVVGKMSLISGWEEGVMGQPAGTQLRLVIPSAQGYGAQGAGQTIMPYSPLCFDIEIVSVK